jgi:hypothetical protein
VIRLAPVVLASVVSFGPSGAIAQDDETLEWLNDYDEAIALAKKTGKPIFLEFRCSP